MSVEGLLVEYMHLIEVHDSDLKVDGTQKVRHYALFSQVATMELW